MLGRCRPEQVAVEAGAGVEQVGEGQLRTHAELERDVAELHVEVDQAGFALVASLGLREPDRELTEQCRPPPPPTLLITVTTLPLPTITSFALRASSSR